MNLGIKSKRNRHSWWSKKGNSIKETKKNWKNIDKTKFKICYSDPKELRK
ncbi:hypothetical protein PAHAL_7G267800 [Panicum hallii]|jgi:hypothetical protein|uniref:Uncharacterized protein n=1 Tax=Panicum hallii TaxID=206008 RepID=A0A2T8IDN1_9POAL|nr:hypothetical protein PAHAL_7G267800 [Panicum hallii]